MVLEGVLLVRSLPEEQHRQLDLLFAAWHTFEIDWATAGLRLFPQARRVYTQRVGRAAVDMCGTSSKSEPWTGAVLCGGGSP